MSYKDDFAACAAVTETNFRQETVPELRVSKITAFALGVSYKNAPQLTYDFLNRILTSTVTMDGYQAKSVSTTTTPFSQLDHEVLEAMHAKLVELGGQPPALPPLRPEPRGRIGKPVPMDL